MGHLLPSLVEGMSNASSVWRGWNWWTQVTSIITNRCNNLVVLARYDTVRFTVTLFANTSCHHWLKVIHSWNIQRYFVFYVQCNDSAYNRVWLFSDDGVLYLWLSVKTSRSVWSMFLLCRVDDKVFNKTRPRCTGPVPMLPSQALAQVRLTCLVHASKVPHIFFSTVPRLKTYL